LCSTDNGFAARAQEELELKKDAERQVKETMEGIHAETNRLKSERGEFELKATRIRQKSQKVCDCLDYSDVRYVDGYISEMVQDTGIRPRGQLMTNRKL